MKIFRRDVISKFCKHNWDPKKRTQRFNDMIQMVGLKMTI